MRKFCVKCSFIDNPHIMLACHTAQLVEPTSRDVAGGAAESFKHLEYGEIVFGECIHIFI
jgi:hypothetical protein